MRWNDNNRFNQEGYSEPTKFPRKEDYANLFAYEEDLTKAEDREAYRNDWLLELAYEEELEWRCEQDNLKAEREEYECHTS